jgi:DNA-binding response OmpR family regulator
VEPQRADSSPRKIILVAEDELLIAMELETMLLDEGYAVMGPVATVAAALAILDTQRPDAGVLDVNLRGEQISPVARVLKSMDVPFLLTSAYDRATLDKNAALNGVTVVGKPASPKQLLAELAGLLEGETL